MRKTYLVMRQELIFTFTRASFLLLAFGLPVAVVLVMGVVKLVQGQSGPDLPAEQETSPEYQLAVEGFVDHASLVRTIPADLQGVLIAYATEPEAIQALEDGEISAYYVIPADYIATGEVDYVFPDDRSYLSDGQKWVIQFALNQNLLRDDPDLADRVWNPIRHLDVRQVSVASGSSTASAEDCSGPGTNCQSNELIRLLPSILVVVFFITFTNSSNMLFNSIGTEKENRTIELLMLMARPRQILVGKTIALGIAGLAQAAAWLGAIYILLNLGGTTLSLPENFEFPVRIVAWGLVFFIGGFGLYASLMAGAGALASRVKESTLATFVALSPLFLGYMVGLIAPLAGKAGSGLMVFLSIFPLTAPVIMVMRLTDHFVPLWQLLLSLVLLFLSAYFTLRIAAAMFKAQNLLSGQPFSARRYFGAMVGRV